MIGLIRRATTERKSVAAFRRAVLDGFGSDAPHKLRLIKDGPLARVASGNWRGREVIVKQFHSRDPETDMAAMVAEHDRLHQLFPHGPLRAGLMLAHAAPQAIAILEKGCGTRLDHVLDHADDSTRTSLVEQAGAWLARALGEGRERGALHSRFWRDQLANEVRELRAASELTALVTRALGHWNALGMSLNKGPVPRGPIHADFAPHNILVDQARGEIWAFDIQRMTPMPLGLDFARLLVALSVQAQRQFPEAPLAYGVLAADRAALLSVPGLEHDATELPFLDFFIGHRLVKALIDKPDHPNTPILQRSLINWLDTPRCL
jgi:hypothetical protein